jgi:FkbM family methyltransferase
LDEGDKAIDIGANVGIITMFMSQIVGKKGHIFAIEASPSNSIILQQNINLNNLDNITLINRAVAEKERQVFMLSPQNTYNDALLVMNESPKPLSEEVQALPFDEIAKEWQIGKSKLIKVDIEGAEIFFFEGAQNYLKMYKPILIFETLQSYTRRFDYSVVDVLLLLRGFGYHVEQIDIETWIALYKNQHNER